MLLRDWSPLEIPIPVTSFIMLEVPLTKVLLKAEVFTFQRRVALTDLFSNTSSCSALRFLLKLTLLYVLDSSKLGVFSQHVLFCFIFYIL